MVKFSPDGDYKHILNRRSCQIWPCSEHVKGASNDFSKVIYHTILILSPPFPSIF